MPNILYPATEERDAMSWHAHAVMYKNVCSGGSAVYI